MSTHFTSDTHFGHKSRVAYRGCETVEEMDDMLIRRWNAVVQPGDTVYHLGDFAFSNPRRAVEIVGQLNGQIKLVPGNHDSKPMRKALENVLEILPALYPLKLNVVQPDGSDMVKRFVLCHYPMLVWDRAHFGTIHLHGHSHGACRYPNPQARILDVGVDTKGHAFAPLTLAEVLQKVDGPDRAHVPFDHHRERLD